MFKPYNYKGYDIKPVAPRGFIWTDNRGLTHYYEGVMKIPFATVWEAEESIDAVCRAMFPDLP